MSYRNKQQKPISKSQQIGNKNKHSSQKKPNSQTCLMSLVIREMEMKTALIFHLTPTIWLSSRTTAHAGEDGGKGESLIISKFFKFFQNFKLFVWGWILFSFVSFFKFTLPYTVLSFILAFSFLIIIFLLSFLRISYVCKLHFLLYSDSTLPHTHPRSSHLLNLC